MEYTRGFKTIIAGCRGLNRLGLKGRLGGVALLEERSLWGCTLEVSSYARAPPMADESFFLAAWGCQSFPGCLQINM